MKQTGAFVVQHRYLDEDGDEQGKFIRVYTTEEKARAAVDQLKPMPGFRLHPDGFHVDFYEFDEDHWTERFVAA